MLKNDTLAETIARFREALGAIATSGPNGAGPEVYEELRGQLLADHRVEPLLPDFVRERRTARDFWNYIKLSFSTYADRSQYIDAQILPIERHFRPERQRTPGERPPEVRIEYAPPRPSPRPESFFVSEERIAELRTVTGQQFDLRKLVRLCEELNITFENACYLATASLVRAILDHVPPIFGLPTFAQVASNYGGRSFKETMQRLENAARKIADAHLHQTVRARETLPTPQQVGFSAELDVLLGEIVRILS
jgi:hypothetical protein